MLYISAVIPPWTLQVDFLCIGSYMYVLYRHKKRFSSVKYASSYIDLLS